MLSCTSMARNIAAPPNGWDLVEDTVTVRDTLMPGTESEWVWNHHETKTLLFLESPLSDVLLVGTYTKEGQFTVEFGDLQEVSISPEADSPLEFAFDYMLENP